jgi:1-acyl-sn-glycerol-3-phosphate acyltransferase
MSPDVKTLTRLINNEVILAMGLSTDGWIAQSLQPILARATWRFCEIFAKADSIISQQGLRAGALWVLQNLTAGLKTRGESNVPRTGPVIIASNHPGTVDSVTLAASAGREDMRIIASAVPFLQNLPNVGQHLIFLPRQNIQARMVVVRQAIKHLREGGALLLFARGSIDPDPAFMRDADVELTAWSRSLEVFLRSAPQTQVVTSIVSHVLHRAYMHHPATWLRRQRRDRQRLAMMLQVIQQMLGKKLDVVPRVSFGEPVRPDAFSSNETGLATIVESATSLLRSHLAWQSQSPM